MSVYIVILVGLTDIASVCIVNQRRIHWNLCQPVYLSYCKLCCSVPQSRYASLKREQACQQESRSVSSSNFRQWPSLIASRTSSADPYLRAGQHRCARRFSVGCISTHCRGICWTIPLSRVLTIVIATRDSLTPTSLLCLLHGALRQFIPG